MHRCKWRLRSASPTALLTLSRPIYNPNSSPSPPCCAGPLLHPSLHPSLISSPHHFLSPSYPPLMPFLSPLPIIFPLPPASLLPPPPSLLPPSSPCFPSPLLTPPPTRPPLQLHLVAPLSAGWGDLGEASRQVGECDTIKVSKLDCWVAV